MCFFYVCCKGEREREIQSEQSNGETNCKKMDTCFHFFTNFFGERFGSDRPDTIQQGSVDTFSREKVEFFHMNRRFLMRQNHKVILIINPLHLYLQPVSFRVSLTWEKRAVGRVLPVRSAFCVYADRTHTHIFCVCKSRTQPTHTHYSNSPTNNKNTS